ncbi:MAG: ethanolamine ammonia-lyase subunit EutC [Burkholderiaceae bacterium]
MTTTLPDHPIHWDSGDAPVHPPAPPADPWISLRRHTPARISLGRSGTSLPTAEVLRFAAAHAGARDAVHLPLDVEALLADLRGQGLAPASVASRAAMRVEYLTRPDLGRQLAAADRDALEPDGDVGLCIVVGDGLSAMAAQMHAAPLIAELAKAGVVARRVVVATQARVALGDEIGERVGASMVLMLLGERPGLSSPDSLGAYLTWAPKAGRADSERNCVSNIRPDGLALPAAAARIAWLVRESQRRRVTGIELKDDSDVAELGVAQAP